MSKNKIILAAVAVLFSGNVPVQIPAGTEVTFPAADSTDAVAEALAQNQKLYAENRDQLAHEVERDGKRFKVTYGLHGARVEEEVIEAAQEEAPAGSQVQPEGDNPGSSESGS
jgi:YD repeat-containing protein